MKTSELTGAALDWAVAKCQGYSKDTAKAAEFAVRRRMFGVHKWSTSWQLGGPIIDKLSKKGLRITCFVATYLKDHAYAQANLDGKFLMGGPTPLIAAMRCYVASELGAEVEIPRELIE